MVKLEQLKEIPNVFILQGDVIGGGAPSKQALKEMKRQGFKAVVDLRTLMEGTMFMKKSVKKLGMNYYNIPIQGSNIGEEQVKQFSEILASADNQPVLVHCGIGGRVKALWERYKAGPKQP